MLAILPKFATSGEFDTPPWPMSDNLKSKLVGPKVAAEHVGVGYSTFRHAVRKGLFPYYKLGGSKLFKLEELDAAFQAFRVASIAEVLS